MRLAALSEVDYWSAPVAHGPLSSTVHVPGSKSLTARALYLAAAASTPGTIVGALDSRDTRLFAQALTLLGARIETTLTKDGVPSLTVAPLPDLGAPSLTSTYEMVTIDCGLAGTVMRFLPALAAMLGRPVTFDGDEGARVRPLAPLLDALMTLGANITFHGETGFLPFSITGPLRVPESGVIAVDASASSQFVSALLLVAPLLPEPLRIIPAREVVSAPHIEMTVRSMQDAGFDISSEVIDGVPQWSCRPGRPTGRSTIIEPDLSNAGPFLAAAHLAGGHVTIPAWPTDTTQAGDAWRNLLADLGATIMLEDRGLILTGPGAGNFDGIDVDLSAIGELTPTLAAVLLFARTPSRIRGVAHLRGHETNRLAALVTEIKRLGGQAEETADGLTITPVALHVADLDSYHDHRMATFGAIIGLMVPGVRVANIETTSKTLPGFDAMWAQMLAGDADA